MIGDNLTVKTESSTGIIDFFFFPPMLNISLKWILNKSIK